LGIARAWALAARMAAARTAVNFMVIGVEWCQVIVLKKVSDKEFDFDLV